MYCTKNILHLCRYLSLSTTFCCFVQMFLICTVTGIFYKFVLYQDIVPLFTLLVKCFEYKLTRNILHLCMYLSLSTTFCCFVQIFLICIVPGIFYRFVIYQDILPLFTVLVKCFNKLSWECHTRGYKMS